MDEIIAELKVNNSSKDAITKINDMLVTLATHVESENRIMDTVNYPYASTHRADHDKISADINKITLIVYGKTAISDYWIAKLEDMFINHIDLHDLQLFTYIANNQQKLG